MGHQQGVDKSSIISFPVTLEGTSKVPQRDTFTMGESRHLQGSGSWLRDLAFWPGFLHYMTSAGLLGRSGRTTRKLEKLQVGSYSNQLLSSAPECTDTLLCALPHVSLTEKRPLIKWADLLMVKKMKRAQEE